MSTQAKEWKFGGHNCVIMNDAQYPTAIGKANSFVCPIGMNEAVGHVLLLRDDLNKIDYDIAHTLEIKQEGGDPSDGIAEVALSFPGLYIDKAIKVTKGPDEHPGTVFLVRFVDPRFFLSRWSETHRQFNVRSWSGGEQAAGFRDDWIRETIKGPDEPYTLSEVIAFLWGDCNNIAGAFPGLPAGYTTQTPPENLHFTGTNPWRSLHNLLHLHGMTTVKDPFSGSHKIILFGDTQTFPAGNFTAMWTSEIYNGGVTFGPEKIRVNFPFVYEDYGSERDTEVIDNFVTTRSFYSRLIETGIPAALPGTTLTLWDSYPARREHSQDAHVVNENECIERANQIVSGWLRNHLQFPRLAPNPVSSGRRFHSILQGLVGGLVPGPRLKAVIWRDYGHTPGMEGDGLVTEILSHPGYDIRVTDEPQTGANQRNFEGVNIDFAEWQSIGEHEGGHDYARPTWPVYPRLPNFVKVIEWADERRCCVEPMAPERKFAEPLDIGKKLWGARVYRYDSAHGGIEELEDCWAHFPQWKIKGEYKVDKNGFYYARLSGMETNQGRTLPLYVCDTQLRPNPPWGVKCKSAPDQLGEVIKDFGLCDVKRVTVDKSSSLMAYVDDEQEEPCSPAVVAAIRASDKPHSVFATIEGKKTPQWWQSPEVESVKIFRFLELGDGAGSYLLPGGAGKMKLPPAPASGDRFLYSKSAGPCYETDWNDPGVTAEHTVLKDVTIDECNVYGTVTHDCQLICDYGCYLICEDPVFTGWCEITLDKETCKIKTVRGAVVELCGDTYQGGGGGSDCPTKHCIPFDPCDPNKDTCPQ